MTPERAKELLPIVQAIADGKQVEWLNPKHLNTVWSRYAGGVRLDDDHILWRVKPEPREWWLVLRTHPGVESSTSFDCKDTADAFAKNTTFQPATVVHVREVLP